jgi:hypothetical protein
LMDQIVVDVVEAMGPCSIYKQPCWLKTLSSPAWSTVATANLSRKTKLTQNHMKIDQIGVESEAPISLRRKYQLLQPAPQPPLHFGQTQSTPSCNMNSVFNM